MTKPQSQRTVPLIAAGLALVCTVIAAGLVVAWWAEGEWLKATESWTPTEATMTSCGLTTFRRSGETTDELQTVCDFEYFAEGQRHEWRVTSYVGWADDGFTGSMPYEDGYVMPIWYDPADPASHTSTQGGDPDPTWLFVALVPLTISLPFWFFGVRGLWRARRHRA